MTDSSQKCHFCGSTNSKIPPVKLYPTENLAMFFIHQKTFKKSVSHYPIKHQQELDSIFQEIFSSPELSEKMNNLRKKEKEKWKKFLLEKGKEIPLTSHEMCSNCYQKVSIEGEIKKLEEFMESKHSRLEQKIGEIAQEIGEEEFKRINKIIEDENEEEMRKYYEEKVKELNQEVKSEKEKSENPNKKPTGSSDYTWLWIILAVVGVILLILILYFILRKKKK